MEKFLHFYGKCRKKISCGEEITIKDKVMICKKCFQETSDMCHECCLPIFKHELTYEASESWNTDSESRSVIWFSVIYVIEIG